MISPIMDLLQQDREFSWGDALKVAFLKITISFISGKTPVSRHNDPERPALLETDASDFAIAGVVSQKFEDRNIYPIGFMSPTIHPPDLNYDVYDREMLAEVLSLKKWR